MNAATAENPTRYLVPDGFTRKVFNPLIARLTKWGISVKGSRVLEVRGRTSGELRTTVVNLLTVGLTTLVIVLVNLTVDAEWEPHDPVAWIAIPIFVAAGMYREYYRSLAFSRNDMPMLLWVDGPYLAVTTVCLAAMFLWPARMASLAGAFLAMSAGCIVSQFFLSGRFAGPRPRPFRPSTNLGCTLGRPRAEGR
jgi:hypothetical protein